MATERAPQDVGGPEQPEDRRGEDRTLSAVDMERDFVELAVAARAKFEAMDATAIAEEISDARAQSVKLMSAFRLHEQQLAELNGLADLLRARPAGDPEVERCLPQLAEAIPHAARLLRQVDAALHRLNVHLTELEDIYRRRNIPQA